MGEVYLAHDTKLGRDVAIKVLPDLFAADPDRLARFQREAQLLASLNHPHIAAIYGLEESSPSAGSGQAGVRALVLEFVDGPTLADRIARGPIPLDEALTFGRQIADALDGAHEHGVVHRDLKPANVKVRPDGTVKVLDFGLAKLTAPPEAEVRAGSAGTSNSPTLTSPAMTRQGVILGTAAYMSPEQAHGSEVDKRADIWAFGCVLYEMLTGTRAFGGEHVTDALAAVVRADPDWHRLPADTPPAIRRLLRWCLQKDRRLRVRDIADVRTEIDDVQKNPFADGDHVPTSGRRGRMMLAAALAVVTLIAGALAIVAFRPAPPAPELRLEISAQGTGEDNLRTVSFAISPDADVVAFVATSEGLPQLWLRPLASPSARPLSGTSGATFPFWSPDSRSLGFFADGKLKCIDIDGGMRL